MRGIIHWDPPNSPACVRHARRPLALFAFANLLQWGIRDILFAAPPAPLTQLQSILAGGQGQARCAYALLPAQANPAAALFAGLEFSAGHACMLINGMQFFSPAHWQPRAPKRGMQQIIPTPASESAPSLYCYAPASLAPLRNMHRAGEPFNLARLHAGFRAQGQVRALSLPASAHWFDGCAAADSPRHPANAPPEALPQAENFCPPLANCLRRH